MKSFETKEDVEQFNSGLPRTPVKPVYKNGVDGYAYFCTCYNKYGDHPEVFNYPETELICRVCGRQLNWDNVK